MSHAGRRDIAMPDLIATLISLFLFEPLQAEMGENLGAARMPQAAVADVAACARTAAPVNIERAARDPWWVAARAVRLWAGRAPPETVLVEAAPGCAAALDSARTPPTGRAA
jgi:hypothetical protein